MIRHLILSFVLFAIPASANQLKIVADTFDADEKQGISVFSGNVKIKKASDELNASKVTVYLDEKRKPTRMVAEGDVAFYVETETGDSYRGMAQKAVFNPIKRVYEFYMDVHLEQINQKKEVNGDEVIIDTIKGTAYAKGAERKPVIMIFDLSEEEKKND